MNSGNQFLKTRFTLHECLTSMSAFRDVAGDAKCSYNLALRRQERHLTGRYPCDPAIWPGFHLFFVQQRLTGLNDLLFVAECILGMFFREEVTVRFANCFVGCFEIQRAGLGTIDENESAL